jgi:cyclic pyranopterin phosphate synthase
LKDGYGRIIDYLRISLTDKCNLRCSYCMPKEGIQHVAHSDILTLEEIGRLASVMKDLGIKRVRLTGGEPLVRKGVTELVRILHTDCCMDNISMTSNGCMISEYAEALKDAGLGSINISLDTLNKDTFIRLTGSDELDKVKEGISSAINAGITVRLNCVPVRDINDNEITEIAGYADKIGVPVRFIELMPVGCGRAHKGVSTDELKAKLEADLGIAYRLSDDELSKRGFYEKQGPAEYYGFGSFPGSVGFISPISHRFCESCNRIRLTASGFLKLCLQYPDGVDLKTPLRCGASDSEIKSIIEEAVLKKPAAHSFTTGSPNTDTRRMVEIGG